MINPVTLSAEQHATSKLISAPLVEQIFQQKHQLTGCHEVQQAIKARAHSSKHARRREETKDLQRQLPASLQRCIDLSQEKGLQLGWRHCQLTYMGSLFISVDSGMLSLFAIIGHLRIHPLIAAAVTPSALSTLCLVQLEVSP